MTSSSNTLPTSVVPYMRAREIEFAAENLRPGRQAHAFFGPTNVTRFCQPASILMPDSANANIVNGLIVGERLYCNSTNYMVSVIGDSMSNTIYINENYVALNISQVGANTAAANDYVVGSIVYQSPTSPTPGTDVSVATFEAQVAYYSSSSGVLVLEPLTGNLTVNAASTSNQSAWIRLSGGSKITSANTIVSGAVLPLNAQVSSLDNVSNKFLVGSYQSNMGVINFSSAAANANVVILSSTSVNANLVGNLISITGQIGLGQVAKVVSLSGNVAVLNVALNPYPTGNSYYGLGGMYVDQVGNLCGVFNLPETQTVQFLTPGQAFTLSDSTVVDDPYSTMSASANYVSSGQIGSGATATPVVQPITSQATAVAALVSGSNNPQTVLGSPGPNTTYAGVLSILAANASANMIYNGTNLSQIGGTFSVSPISQTFMTPMPKSQNTNYGIMVSSVDIWFNTKPTGSSPQFPVQLSIVETANGVPTQNVIATSTVPYHQILTSTTPDSINVGSLTANNTTVTKFAFPDPVYLKPASLYALTLYSESPDYEVYIAKVGDTDITTGGASQSKRVVSQNSVVAFFTSQNATVWDPIPNQMLMFVLNKAQFSLNPVTVSFNMIPIQDFVAYDEILLLSSDLTFTPCDLTYSVQTTLANSLAPDPTFTFVEPNQTWDFGQDLTTSSLNGTRRRVIFPGNTAGLVVDVNMQTQNPDLSPLFNAEMLAASLYTNVINAGDINQNQITITSPGNHINAANIVVTISAPDLSGGIQAKANVPSSGLSGNSLVGIMITTPGTGYSKSPTITISEPGAPANATAVITGEDSTSGGNALARYITRPITLANGMAAGDLRVYLSAIAPVGTNVLVYYKVLGTADNRTMDNIPWVEMTAEPTNQVSPDQNTPVALAFCPSLGTNGLPTGTLQYTLNNVTYPLGGTFGTFAIKIVLFANDPTVTPVVQGMQVIAYPAG